MPTLISEAPTEGAWPTGLSAAALRGQAAQAGFDAVGIADPDAVAEAGHHLLQCLQSGQQGDMEWLTATAERRRHPRALWPEVRSVIVLGLNYGPKRDPLDLLAHKNRGAISVYAQGGDYHDLLKKRLKRVARWLVGETGCQVKVFVDTAPVLEKPLAEAAGIGWQGKHTNLVSTNVGSWLFIGSIFTNLDLPTNQADPDRCGSCRRCLDVCPTDAFPAPYRLDARRCISYLTIEHKGPIARDLRAAIGNRIYGCDDCLAVCPWNKFAHAGREQALNPRPELDAPALVDLAELDDAAFRKVFAGTAVKRTGRNRFLRNVAIALGNSGDGAALPAVERLLTDQSALVRAMAVWALSRLASPARFAALRERHLPAEADGQVGDEWRSGGA